MNFLNIKRAVIIPVIACLTSITVSCSGNKDDGGGNGGGGGISVVNAGKVLCNGSGISGVVVTDGTQFAVTDASGAFSLPYNPIATHVYISSPAGYTVPVENSVPKFWVRLKDISDKKSITFNLTKLSQNDNKHFFIAVGDPQVRNATELGKLSPILSYMKQEIESKGMNPVHIMVAGDVVFDTPKMHDMSKTYFSALNNPVYYAIGNHDHVYKSTDAVTTANDKSADSVFIRHYGPTYYSFNKGMVHYIVLDNILYEGGSGPTYTINFTQAELSWVAKDLSYISKDRAIVVMFHGPSKTRTKSTYGNSASLHALLSGYANVQIISGHTHYNTVMADNTGITEHNVGAACGGFWEGPVCLDGAELGYKIFEVDGTSFKWEYRSYVNANTQFSAYIPQNRAPVLPPSDQLLVNVWDWDPAWSVKYSEDGGLTYKDMTRIEEKAYDPTAYLFFGIDGDNKIPTRSWINSTLTDHIFKCTPSTGVHSVKVKVTTRFGVEYTKVMEF